MYTKVEENWDITFVRFVYLDTGIIPHQVDDDGTVRYI